MNNQERYALAVQGSTDGLWDWNFITDEAYFSPEFKKMLGLTDLEMPNVFDSFESRLHPKDRDRVLTSIQAHKELQKPFDEQFRLRTKTGAYSWFNARGQALWNESGQAIRMVGLITDISFWKQAEEEHQESEARARAIVDTAVDGIVIINEQRIIQSFNAAAERLFGYNAEEVTGKNVNMLMPEPYHSEHEGYVKTYLGTGTKKIIGIGREVVGKRKDGTTFPMNLAVSEVTMAEGKQRFFTGIIRDISQQKEAEENLREREARMTAILETAVEAIITINTRGIIESFNPSAETMFGYKASEIIGQKINVLQPEPYTKEHDTYLQNFLRTRNKKIIGIGRELVGIRKDGSQLPIFLSVAQVRLRDRIIFSGIIRDISEQKEYERKVLEITERLTLATRSADIGIWEWDVTNNVLNWDEVMYKLYGIKAKDFTGAYDAWQKGLHPEDRSKAESEINAALANEKEFDTEFRVIWPKGEVRTIRANAIIQRDKKGNPLLMVGVNWDITRLKAVEEQMRLAKEAAEAASRSKSEFLANMSHEIRTPINGVMGMIELLLNTQVSKKQEEFLTMARHSAESLMSVINDILDFSKIEAGKLAIDVHAFQLRETVEGTVSTLGMRAGEKNLELTCRIAPDVPDRLMGDSGRLRQMLINLIGNAIKFTTQGEIAVQVKMVKTSQPLPLDDQINLHLSVRDTGMGIPLEKQKRIFESFSQADASTTREFGGTGLGLTISSQLAALMGGRLWVESKPGKGSTFHFTLGLGRDKSNPVKNPVLTTSLKNLRVLAVDDNATTRRIIKEALEGWGIKVTMAEDAMEALEILGKTRAGFDLMVTDFHMPQMNGMQLAEQVRGNPAFAKIKIIMLSSAAKLRTNGEVQGILDDSLMKPVRQSELLQAIQKTMGLDPAVLSSTKQGTIDKESQASLRILLAEDSEINQAVAVGLLENAGHGVTVTSNGIEAIKALVTLDFDVVLMDVQMPEMDGITATKEIRNPKSAVKNHTIPIIAMTAHAMKGDRERCLKAGMDGYVSKPIRPRELFKALKEVNPAAKEEQGQPKTAKTNLDKVFNLEQALQPVDGNLDLLNRIIDMFLKSGPALVEDVGNGLEKKDPDTVRNTAHKLKGTVGNFGAKPAFNAALVLEEIGANGDLKDAGTAFKALQHEVGILLKVLGDFREKNT